MLDGLLEIFETMRRNKLRTALTSLAVAWGIFLLVVLQAAGVGLRHSVEHQFADDATNALWIHGGTTSIPFEGLPPGRDVVLDNSDFDSFVRSLDGLEYITGRFYLWGDLSISRGAKSGNFSLRAVHPDHQYLEKTLILEGRYLNEIDIRDRRKVAVIGEGVRDFFFSGESAIGEFLNVGGISYRVVGVSTDEASEGDLQTLFIPVSTAQRAYNGGTRLHGILLTFGDASLEKSRVIAERARRMLAKAHDFSPDDRRALRLRNNLEEFEQFNQIFEWIAVFLWIVGIGTIVAGIVGVSNIMLISVAERAREFGVRKAIGATPGSIIRMVVVEAVLLTSVAGYLGLIGGVATVELANKVIPENEYFMNAQVDLGLALAAAALLIFFGSVAGYIPARRAARVDPVVALRDE